MAEAGFKPRLSGARALISSSYCLPRGTAVSQVVCAWDRGPAGIRGWEGRGCAGGPPTATWVGPAVALSHSPVSWEAGCASGTRGA